MARPWKHPKTGVYYLRKRVPVDLRKVVGSETVKVTLRTKDPTIAKSAFVKALGALEARWANMRLGGQKLTEREAHTLANQTHAIWMAAHRDEPSIQAFWRSDLYSRLWTAKAVDLDAIEKGEPIPKTLFDDMLIEPMRKFCERRARDCLQRNGLTVDDQSRAKVERAMGAATQRASLSLKRMSQGYDQEEQLTQPLLSHLSSDSPPKHLSGFERTSDSQGQKLTLGELLEGWWQESKAAGRKPSTYESYRNTVSYLQRFLGHDDARRVSAENIIAFKDHRLRTPSPKTGRAVSAKTVKDSDLSALKTLFGWAVTNRKLAENPAQKISIKMSKPLRLRSKSFTDAEAVAILSAARAYGNSSEHPGTAAAKRWVPWLCAFTGARVGEIAQLRRQDVRREATHWVIRITPEAGTVKTNEAREIPLHPQIDAIGFTAFIDACAPGHLFLRPGKGGDVLGSLQGIKNRLAEFARKIVSDPAVAPNHGWRHRFKTMGMEAGITPRILDSIQGQAPRSVADTYGDVTMKTMIAAINRLPWFDLPA